MKKPINEQVVVITGASSGIGRETALYLAHKGAKVVVSARRDEVLDDLVTEIKVAGGEATAIPADVSQYAEVEALVDLAVEAYGRIDTWVNNAGILLVAAFEKTEVEEARRIFDTNFWGEYHGCKAVLPVMRRQGSGTIVNISSGMARRPIPLYSAYSSSKAAIGALSEALRSELEGSGINVTIVLPASIDTPVYQNARSKEGFVPRPAPPIYKPSEVARAIEIAATEHRRDIYAGPAGFFLAAANVVLPGPMDKLLQAVVRRVALTGQPEPPTGNDTMDAPRQEYTTAEGGWRGRRYRAAEFASRVTIGALGLLLVRRLFKR